MLPQVRRGSGKFQKSPMMEDPAVSEPRSVPHHPPVKELFLAASPTSPSRFVPCYTICHHREEVGPVPFAIAPQLAVLLALQCTEIQDQSTAEFNLPHNANAYQAGPKGPELTLLQNSFRPLPDGTPHVCSALLHFPVLL